MLTRSILVVGLIAAACTPAGPADLVTRSDSAGVAIVENLTPLERLPVYEIAHPPLFEISSSESCGTVLFRITAVAPLGHGGLAVGSHGTSNVQVFDADGGCVRTIGRDGDGPGEFRSIGAVIPLPADSLGVFDPQRQRLSVFDASGAFGRSTDFSGITGVPGATRLLGLSNGLAYVRDAGIASTPTPQTYRYTAPSFRLDTDGTVAAEYGAFPGVEGFSTDETYGPLPFGARLSTAAAGEAFIVGTGERPEIRSFASTGQLARIVRWPDHDRAVTPQMTDAYVRALLDRASDAERPRVEAMVDVLPFADREPAYARIVAAVDGTVWVGEYPGLAAMLPEDRPPARSWMVIDPGGVGRARILTPAGFEPHALTGERVYGVYRDDLAVESVRAYALPRMDVEP